MKSNWRESTTTISRLVLSDKHQSCRAGTSSKRLLKLRSKLKGVTEGLTNCHFQEGDATDLHDLTDQSFDLVVNIF